jgi:hypothetical protein
MKHGRTEEWAKWRRLVSEQIASGRTVAAFCRDRGLRDWQFYDWTKRVREAEAAKFVTVGSCRYRGTGVHGGRQGD